MVWADIAVAAAGVISAGLGAYSASQSNKTAGRALDLAADQQGKQDLSFQQLQDLMSNPQTFFDSPVYQAAFGQGSKAVARGQAAGGFLGSGNMAAGLQEYGQSFGQQQLLGQEQLLAGMSGTGFNPTGALNTGLNAQKQTFDQLGSVLAGLGYTSGAIGRGGGGAGFTPANDSSLGGTTADWGGGASAIQPALPYG